MYNIKYLFATRHNIQKYGELALELLLHMNGYNVNQIVNSSSNDRHKILSYIIESNIITKQEIKNHLTYLINMNHRRKVAVERWKSDIQWVNDYHLEEQDLAWLSGTAMYRFRSNNKMSSKV